MVSLVGCMRDFNSRTHVECDCSNVTVPLSLKISTHALTWSATEHGVLCWAWLEISTHALTWSATDVLIELQAILGISTHALTWSAT